MKNLRARPFRSAKEELTQRPLELPEELESQSLRIAFTDEEFLLRKELRPIRLQLELLKPELYLRDQKIESTVVFFGSARIPEPAVAKKKLADLKTLLKQSPDNVDLKQQIAIADNVARRSIYYDEARKLAAIISEKCQSKESRNFVVITGGGPGIMEAANRGAHDVKGKSIGLNIVLPFEQAPNPYITPDLNFQFHYFAIRKMHFLIRARALIGFPGGFGTFDEVFEALTLLQTNKIQRIPVLLFSKDYWTKVINFEALVEEGTISPEDLLLFQYVETAEEAWKIISDFYHL